MIDFSQADIIVVGSGFFGAVIAERCSSRLGKKVLIIDRRSHWGGNSFSEVDPNTGIEVHRYGAHIFHTSNQKVWDYIHQFSNFTPYQHRVFARYREQTYVMPINLLTICQFFGRSMTPDEARGLIKKYTIDFGDKPPSNLEEQAISTIGRPLYEAFIRGYTKKQWKTDPRDLPASIIDRLPIRFNFDSRYFKDRYEGLPAGGYGAIFDRMLSRPNISVLLDTDFFSIRGLVATAGKPVVYTGPIDRYFDFRFGKLNWRSVRFEKEILPVDDFQGAPVINFADEDIPYTRITEFRHLHPERNYGKDSTVIFREYAHPTTSIDEPCYPINTNKDREIYGRYRALAAQHKNVIFGGRLGTYRYIDMHQAIAAALAAFERVLEPHFLDGVPLGGNVVEA